MLVRGQFPGQIPQKEQTTTFCLLVGQVGIARRRPGEAAQSQLVVEVVAVKMIRTVEIRFVSMEPVLIKNNRILSV